MCCEKNTPISSEILVVDDVAQNRKLLTGLLTKQGYRVRPASDGALALRSAVLKPPDLVLLDVMMPGIDGFETCRRLKNDPATRDIPVIFMTALNDVQDKLKGFEAGGVDYIIKPFSKPEVIARINNQLSLFSLKKKLEEKNYLLQQTVDKLTDALAEIKTLQGVIPICCSCKRIRDEEGVWEPLEKYFSTHTDAVFSHGICRECTDRLYPEIQIPDD
ncbi:MAG: hypothetical protein A2277_04130 [Desulfobacterales bacterium RIFOXYA12_FULL_46_15]|nr:MAG: hypothetical protein A2097_12320 [Desulfobacula sp. GWF2_41_7]OGR22153.1 MAG: hypothetical protein A2277_04130 [Desulfobacterales bacterium RIFOXYA12_FULL_46_15]